MELRPGRYLLYPWSPASLAKVRNRKIPPLTKKDLIYFPQHLLNYGRSHRQALIRITRTSAWGQGRESGLEVFEKFFLLSVVILLGDQTLIQKAFQCCQFSLELVLSLGGYFRIDLFAWSLSYIIL